jgi:hypothetical protein
VLVTIDRDTPDQNEEHAEEPDIEANPKFGSGAIFLIAARTMDTREKNGSVINECRPSEKCDAEVAQNVEATRFGRL